MESLSDLRLFTIPNVLSQIGAKIILLLLSISYVRLKCEKHFAGFKFHSFLSY